MYRRRIICSIITILCCSLVQSQENFTKRRPGAQRRQARCDCAQALVDLAGEMNELLGATARFQQSALVTSCKEEDSVIAQAPHETVAHVKQNIERATKQAKKLRILLQEVTQQLLTPVPAA